jgi:hypothetical protein
MVALLALTLISATWAVAEEAVSKGASEPLTVEYRYLANATPPEPEETITAEDGTPYRLVSLSEPIIDPSYVPPTRSYERQVTKKVPREGIDTLDDYFSARLSIEDGEYGGFIGRIADSYEVETVYESWSGQVDCSHEIEGLPDNDVVRLPTTMDFEVSSDAAPDATQTKTLTLLDVRYEVTGTNGLGLPNSYKAYLTYRGEESWLEVHHYIVTASYRGTVPSSVPRYLVTATYEPQSAPTVEPPPASVEQPRLLPEPEVPLASPAALPLWAILAAALAVLVLGWLLVWTLLFRKNAELVKEADDRREVLVRRRVRVVDGLASFEVPDEIELYDGARYSVELKPRLASQEGEMCVCWRERVIAREALGPSIALDLVGVENASVLGIVAEEALGILEWETGA